MSEAAFAHSLGRESRDPLVRQALERVRQGLGPPHELYLAPYRDKIDWLLFPPWARPSDPEAFEGCAHEG